jgi:hypothetical protein
MEEYVDIVLCSSGCLSESKAFPYRSYDTKNLGCKMWNSPRFDGESSINQWVLCRLSGFKEKCESKVDTTVRIRKKLQNEIKDSLKQKVDKYYEMIPDDVYNAFKFSGDKELLYFFFTEMCKARGEERTMTTNEVDAESFRGIQLEEFSGVLMGLSLANLLFRSFDYGFIVHFAKSAGEKLGKRIPRKSSWKDIEYGSVKDNGVREFVIRDGFIYKACVDMEHYFIRRMYNNTTTKGRSYGFFAEKIVFVLDYACHVVDGGFKDSCECFDYPPCHSVHSGHILVDYAQGVLEETATVQASLSFDEITQESERIAQEMLRTGKIFSVVDDAAAAVETVNNEPNNNKMFTPRKKEEEGFRMMATFTTPDDNFDSEDDVECEEREREEHRAAKARRNKMRRNDDVEVDDDDDVRAHGREEEYHHLEEEEKEAVKEFITMIRRGKISDSSCRKEQPQQPRRDDVEIKPHKRSLRMITEEDGVVKSTTKSKSSKSLSYEEMINCQRHLDEVNRREKFAEEQSRKAIAKELRKMEELDEKRRQKEKQRLEEVERRAYENALLVVSSTRGNRGNGGGCGRKSTTTRSDRGNGGGCGRKRTKTATFDENISHLSPKTKAYLIYDRYGKGNFLV